jgi:hypothetical protein
MPLSVSVPAPWLPVVLGVCLALGVTARLALPLVVLLRVYARCDGTMRRLVMGPSVDAGVAPALFQRVASGALRSLQLLQVYVALVREAPALLLLAVLAPSTQYSERYLTQAGHSMLRFAQRAAAERRGVCDEVAPAGGAPSSRSSGPSAVDASVGDGGDRERESRGRGGVVVNHSNVQFSVAHAVRACHASVRVDVLALSATLDVAILAIVAFIVSPSQTHARGGVLVTAFELAASLHVLLLCSMVALPWRALATVAAALDPAGAGPAPSSHVLAAAHRRLGQHWLSPLALLREWAPAAYDRLVCAYVQANGPLVPPLHGRLLSQRAKMTEVGGGDAVDLVLDPGEAGLGPAAGVPSSDAGAVTRAAGAGSGSVGGVGGNSSSMGSSSGSGDSPLEQQLSNPLIVSRNARAASMRTAAAAAAPLPPVPPAVVPAHDAGAASYSVVPGGASGSGVKLAASFAHAPTVLLPGVEGGAAVSSPSASPLHAAAPATAAARAGLPGEEKTALGYAHARDSEQP